MAAHRPQGTDEAAVVELAGGLLQEAGELVPVAEVQAHAAAAGVQVPVAGQPVPAPVDQVPVARELVQAAGAAVVLGSAGRLVVQPAKQCG